MLWRIKRFIRKIRNIFLWLPILWRDEQWDGTYVFRILDFKFKLMEENFINDAYVADAKKCAREIHICRLLCKRLIDCEYEEMLGLIHHSIDFDDFIQRLNSGQKTITCSRLGYGGKRWMMYEDYMIQQDLDLLFKIMNKHINCWWD
jgi:hypothetical protein